MGMSNIRYVKIRDIASINPSSIKKDYPFQNIEYIDIASVGSNVCFGTKSYVLKSAPGRAKRLVQDGDTIISTVRPNLKTYLKIKQPKDNLVVSTGFAVLRPSDMVDSNYLFYAVSNQPFIDYLSAIADSKTTSYPAVDTGVVANAEIAFPDIEIQKRIGMTLSVYDDFIDNNNRRIAILEDMAQHLYREWFVNFRFSGYEKVQMVECESGFIPKGWGLVLFSDAVTINPKYQNPKSELYSYIEMADLNNYNMLVNIKEKRSEFSGSKFSNGDTLVARITPCLENGKTGFVQCLNEGEIGTGSTEFIVLQAKKILPEMVYLLARQENFRNILIKSMSGASGRQRANTESLHELKIAVPTTFVLDKFKKIIEPIFKQIEYLNSKNHILGKTRDLLLPRLISGDIDVSELEIPVPEVD